MADSVLLIDDDVEALRSLGQLFERAGGEVARELDLETGLAAWDRLRPDVVLLDFGLCARAGESPLAPFRERHAAVVLLIDEGEQAAAIAAMQAGAESFLVRPADIHQLQAVAARVAEKARLRRLTELLLLRDQPGEGLGSLGDSPAMRRLVREAGEAANAGSTPLVLVGEHGVGKGWLARVIHRMSPRSRGALVELQGRGVAPETLLGRLFGHEQIGPGGARERHAGVVESAAGGTIHLRDLADLPPEAQPPLVKLLESRAFRRVGGTRDLTVDVRIMAGSTRPVPALIDAGVIRDDLGYRLNVLSVTIPPVRSRSREDRLALLAAVAERLRDEVPEGPAAIAPEALERLVTHPWPGNVTEMIHVIGRALILARGQEAVGLDHLPGEFRNRAGPGDRRHTPITLDQLERSQIERTLRHHGGNRTKAAHELGISRATLINKIKRYSIER